MVSLCLSQLDYLNLILAFLPYCTINQVQRIQNYGVKLILGKTKYDSNTQSLAELHCLPIKSRSKFKILKLVFKCLRGEAPDYLRNLLIRCPETSWTLRSSSIKDCLVILGTMKKTSASRLFSVIGPTLCNGLPSFIKDSGDVDEFKRKLKAFLFVNRDF